MKASLTLLVARLSSAAAALLFATIFTPVLQAAAAPCTPAPPGMVGWWRAEGNANDAADGNNGTIAGTGTVSYGPGLVGQSLVFDGTHRDRVNLGNPTDLQLEDFTIEAWVKRSSPTVTSFDVLGVDGSVSGDGAVILGYGRGGYGFGLANDGRIFISRVDLDGLFSAPLVTDVNWHHLAVTKSGSSAVFYLDGAAQATPAYDHPAPYTFDDGTCGCSAAAAIGSRGDARGGTFFGMIDEVAIYNRPLSAAEIQAIYTASSAGKCPILPVPVIEVSPLAEFPGDTNLIVIAPDGLSANVTFDGSRSYDVNDTPLYYFWYEGATLLATTAVTTQLLGVGTHVVTLLVEDTFPQGTNSASVTVEVVTPGQSIAIVMGLLDNANLPRNSRRLLMASLGAAAGSFDRGHVRAGINQLRAFENKVRAQVARSNPVLANELIGAAQTIIKALRAE